MQLTGNKEKDSEYYDGLYLRGFTAAEYYPIYKFALQILKSFPSPRVLELGCGLGDMAKMIMAEGISYRGFDYSEEAIKRCKNLCPQGDFRVGNIYNDNDYKPFDYNTVIALEVLEHVDDMQIFRSIPPGVRLIASVPNFKDKAHLRIYEDIKEDIIERYWPYFQVLAIKTFKGNSPGTDYEANVHLFHGIKMLS
ncbi:MAG: class I SAM-dependent methyltransferase [candidate division Zixibacteria bacterium]|nr:class I SAM-dependent methyltransferase [candidate division Zixibacteria bacterium]